MAHVLSVLKYTPRNLHQVYPGTTKLSSHLMVNHYLNVKTVQSGSHNGHDFIS